MSTVVEVAPCEACCVFALTVMLTPLLSSLAPPVSAELDLPGVFTTLPVMDACVDAADADSVEEVTTAAASAMAFALSDLRNGAGDMVSGARANLPPDLLVPPFVAAAALASAPSCLPSNGFATCPEAAHAAAAAADRTATPPSPPCPTAEPFSGGEGHGVSGSGVLAATSAESVLVFSAAGMGAPAVVFGASFGAPPCPCL